MVSMTKDDDSWGNDDYAAARTEKQQSEIRALKPEDRLNGTQVYAATAHYLQEHGWQSVGIVSATADAAIDPKSPRNREIFTTTNDRGRQIITPPVTDKPENNVDFDPLTYKLGQNAYGISDALRDGLKVAGDERPATISVKIGQDRPVFPRLAKVVNALNATFFGKIIPKKLVDSVNRRGHWTHLQVKIDKGSKVTAIHTDSMKGRIAESYDLDPVRKAVKGVFPEATFETKYIGAQKDNFNCGRFACSAEQAVCNPDATQRATNDPLGYAKSVIKVDEKCNTYSDYLNTREGPLDNPQRYAIGNLSKEAAQVAVSKDSTKTMSAIAALEARTKEKQQEAQQYAQIDTNLEGVAQNKGLQNAIQGDLTQTSAQRTMTAQEVEKKAQEAQPKPQGDLIKGALVKSALKGSRRDTPPTPPVPKGAGMEGP